MRTRYDIKPSSRGRESSSMTVPESGSSRGAAPNGGSCGDEPAVFVPPSLPASSALRRALCCSSSRSRCRRSRFCGPQAHGAVIQAACVRLQCCAHVVRTVFRWLEAAQMRPHCTQYIKGAACHTLDQNFLQAPMVRLPIALAISLGSRPWRRTASRYRACTSVQHLRASQVRVNVCSRALYPASCSSKQRSSFDTRPYPPNSDGQQQILQKWHAPTSPRSMAGWSGVHSADSAPTPCADVSPRSPQQTPHPPRPRRSRGK